MKKIFSLFAALTLSAGLWAIDNVAYIDANGQPQTANGVIEITNATEAVTWAAGWYVVTGEDVQLAKGAVCQGAVNIILADGAKLTAAGKEEDELPGIQVSGEGNSLTIYGQTAQSGQLIANGGMFAAGIGGEIGQDGNNIIINGGIVTATGGESAAGIGGGAYASGSNITINSGTVTANGGESAAGIGGGETGDGSNITINGGEVTATGGDFGAAGIGGGFHRKGSYITINGGNVTANGGMDAAGIGGGSYGGGSNITINGGTVKATSDGADGIGAGMGYSASDIFVATSLVVKADNTNPPTTVITNTGADLASSLAGKQYATIEPVLPISTSYIDENGVEQNIDAWEVKDASEAVTWAAGWYVVTGTDVQLAKGAVCNGAVNIILADGAKLTATGGDGTPGIQTDNEDSFAIYGQTAQSGQLIANGGASSAGIGGGRGRDGSNITINGGIITATGGQAGAGIGGGSAGRGSNITINAGIVTATGRGEAAGIGGGSGPGGRCSDIIINGGTVTAIGGENGNGIGADETEDASNIIIATDLVVKADGNNPPTTVIENDGNDLADKLAGKQYVTVEEGSDPTALPTLFGDGVKGNKFLHNGQLIIRKDGKTYTTLGQEVR